MMGFQLDQPGVRRQLRLAGMAALVAAAGMQNAQADALNGRTLYLNGPVGGGASCTTCHGASPAANVSGILRGANAPAVISAAIAGNKGGMGTLYNGKFSTAEIADLAAFIGNPTVTAGPTASLSPASLSFSGTTIGQTSATLAATLSNTGSGALNIDTIGLAGANAGDYSLAGGTCAAGTPVAAGANCTVQVNFKPSAAGARAASLNIAHNATGGVSSVSLSGTGNAAAQPTIGVSATSVNFGALTVNSSSPVQTITVSNSGQAALTFSGIGLNGTNGNIVTLGGTCAVATPVAAGASCTVTVQARPIAVGAFSANLNMASNASNGIVTIGLSGSAAAVAAAALTATPSALAFGSQTVGAAATTQNVVLANSGNVAVAFTGTSVTGAASVTIGAGNNCTGTLAVGASCTIPVLFAPSAEGAVAATLSALSNAAPVSVSISGTGTSAAVAKPTLSDSGTFSFADTQVGKSAALHSTILRNPGTVALKVTSLALGGSNAADFVLSGTCSVNGTVSPSGSCTVDSVFKPSAAGARSADLVLITDGGTQFNLRLAGNGVAIATAPVLTVAPQSFDFGAATIGATAPTKRITLSNTGTAALALNSAVFTGPFSRVTDSTGCAALPLSLAPGASCDLVVAYTPTVAGASSGSVVIQGDAGATSTIALAGLGNVAAAATPAAVQNQGGGGCSAISGGSDPMLAFLVLLALGVLGWRSRKSA